MDAFTGTWRLLRLALRRDRIKLTIWVVVIVGFLLSTMPTYVTTYASDEARELYASSTAASLVTRLLAGAITGSSFGEIIIMETYLFFVLLIALMNIFLVVRHTRQNEELGRSELIGSLRVGRSASLTAALILALGVNSIVTVGVYLALLSGDLPSGSSLLYSVVLGSIGMVFAGVAAVTAQLSENARGASGIAGLVLGISILVRGVGDALGTVNADGMSVTTGWLSWLSPVGWGSNAQPFATDNWWVLGMFIVFIIGLLAGAYILLSRRDIGAGLLPSRPGLLRARPALLAPLGLQWRLHKISCIAWGVSISAVGVIVAAVANEFTEMIEENHEFREILGQLGSDGSAAEMMLSATFAIIGLAVVAFAIQAALRMRHEEAESRVELLFSSRLGRLTWMARYVTFTVLGSIGILLICGLASGVTYGLVAGNLVGNTAEIVLAMLVYIPAVIVFIAVVTLLFAALPTVATAVSWAIFGACVFLGQFGAFLELPNIVMNVSPLTHIPALPMESIDWMPLGVLSGIAAVIFAASFAFFRRRDITTE